MNVHLRVRRSRRSNDQRGIVVVWMMIVLVLLLGVATFAVDLGYAYYTGEKAQNAADAAALSGAVWLPQDCKGARIRARTIAAENGFANINVTSHCDDPNVKPNQLRVQVSRNVDTLFGRVFGVKTLTIRRTANAEFDPPVSLGNPTSNFGDAPECQGGCYASQMWAVLSGQLEDKVNGNAIGMGWCYQAADNCPQSGLNNSDRDPNGELYEIDNRGAAAMSIHLFDPAFIETMDHCGNPNRDGPFNAQQADYLYGTSNKNGNIVTPPPRPYPANVWGTNWLNAHPAAWDQPNPTPDKYCTGDNTAGGDWDVNGSPALNDPAKWEAYQDPTKAQSTTYTLYQLVDPLNPLNGPKLCSWTYKGYFGPANMPTNPSALEKPSEDSFHQWDDFTQTASCPVLDPASEGTRFALQVTTDAMTAGHNDYAIAACDSCARANPLKDDTVRSDGTVSVAAITKMGLYTHAVGGTTPRFYLARVPTWAAGQTLTVDFYDIGDGSYNTLDLTLLNGDTGTEMSGCTFVDPTTRNYLNGRPVPWSSQSDTDWGSFTSMGGGCQAHLTGGNDGSVWKWNGKWVVVHVPIPPDYSCNDDVFTSCWIQIEYQLDPQIEYQLDPSAQLWDTTTWAAHLSGNPDRLIK